MGLVPLALARQLAGLLGGRLRSALPVCGQAVLGSIAMASSGAIARWSFTQCCVSMVSIDTGRGT